MAVVVVVVVVVVVARAVVALLQLRVHWCAGDVAGPVVVGIGRCHRTPPIVLLPLLLLLLRLLQLLLFSGSGYY